jgi:hypothetical protein
LKKTVLCITFFIFVSVVFLTSAGCAISIHEGSRKGKIVAADTGEPIEDAVVLGVWYTYRSTNTGTVSSYYATRETKSDKNGQFVLPGLGTWFYVNLAPPIIQISKTNYALFRYRWLPDKDLMKLHTGIIWNDNMPIIPLRKLSEEERQETPYPKPTANWSCQLTN